MLDSDENEEEKELFDYEEEPIDGSGREQHQLNGRNPNEIIRLFEADWAQR